MQIFFPPIRAVPPLPSFDGVMLIVCLLWMPAVVSSTAGSRRATDPGISQSEMEPDGAELEKKEVCDSQLPLAFVWVLCSFARCSLPLPLVCVHRLSGCCGCSDSCRRRLLAHSLEFWALHLHPRLR
jgi:hypothetical protein